jgi:hypothetical protein
MLIVVLRHDVTHASALSGVFGQLLQAASRQRHWVRLIV